MTGGKRLVSDMGYEDFALLIAHMDGEAQFRMPRDAADPSGRFFATGDEFARECRQYRAGMVRYWREFQGSDRGTGDPYPEFIYSPVSFVTFGDADCVSVVAIDDFHPMTWLTTSTLPMRQTCLAFCPKIESLGLDSIRVNSGTPMSDRVFRSARDLFPSGEDRNPSGQSLLSKDRPLFSISYFKLNAMAIVGPGLLFEEAVLRAIGARIAETLDNLRKYATSVGSRSGAMFSEEDVNSFRCVLLDPQGWSDVATLMFANNYSVIMSVMAALRQLTFTDLYKTQNGRLLQNAVKSFGVHSRFADKPAGPSAEKSAEKSAGDKDKLLYKNHVFCSTYTTLGIAEKAFRAKGKGTHGYVAASTEVEVDPGHMGAARRIARFKNLRTRPAANLNDRPFFWCTIGQGDVSLPHLASDGPGTDTPIETRELIRHIVSARDCNGPHPQDDRGTLYPHVLGMSTGLRIPIVFRDDGVSGTDHTDMRSVLSTLEDKLFQGKTSPLGLIELRKSLRKIRISSPLSQAVVDLFANYASCVADPFIIERVLDLFDTFCATYELLVKELPRMLEKRTSSTPRETADDADYLCHTFLQNEDIRDLVELVTLLQNALTHRLRPASRGAKKWGASLDIRGGNVDKLVNAADTPLKCGLGILRRVMNGWTGVYTPQPQRSDEENAKRIGGTSLISCDLRSLTHQLRIGPMDGVFLASISLSTAHLTRPSAFCIHLHETAHLICDLLRRDQCPHCSSNCPSICYAKRGHKTEDGASIVLERHQDIFAELLVHYFVFGDDHRTYFRNYLANYSLDPIAYCQDAGDSFRRMFEVLIRGFLATEPFRAKKRDPALYSWANRAEEPPAHKMRDIYAEFKDAVRDAGPFFIGFRRLWREDHVDFDDQVYGMFRRVYNSTYAPLCCMWNHASRVFYGVTRDNADKAVRGTDTTDEKELAAVAAEVRAGLRRGHPLVRSQFRVKGRRLSDKDAEQLDPFLLMRLLLKEHITCLFGAPAHRKLRLGPLDGGIDTTTTQVCLIRRADTGEPYPEALPPGMKWHTQLIDRNTNGLFSVDPAVRSSYMRHRIAIVKTLWDISANLRARRFRRLFQMASYEEEPTP